MSQANSDVTVLEPTQSTQALVIVCTSPKGGAGKSTVLQAVAVGAAMDGHRVTILDYDPQRTSQKWAQRRAACEGVAPVSAAAGTWTGVRDELRHAMQQHDVVVVDTPTSVEDHIAEIDAIIRAASYVLVPTGPQYIDRESVKPWMTVIRSRTNNASFILNRVNRQTRSLRDAKMDLVGVGKLCPIEVPSYEDIHMQQEPGYSVVEIADAKGHGDLGAIWKFVKSELSIQ